MSDVDKQIIEFTRMWIPYGGPSAADIFVEFGLTPTRFLDRLDALVCSVEPASLSAGELRYFESVRRRSDSVVRR